MGGGKVVKIKNALTVPVHLKKTNLYDLGTIPAGGEVEVTIDPETVSLEIQPTA